MKKTLFTASSAANFLSLIALVAMTLVTVVDVCGRRFFNSPLTGSVDIVRLCLAVSIFFALAYCETHQAHINVDILTKLFPQKAQHIVDFFIQLFSFVTVSIISWQMYLYAVKLSDAH